MKSKSLITDHARAGAKAILDIVAPALRDDERREAFSLFFEAIKATLDSYEAQSSHMRKRVIPSDN